MNKIINETDFKVKQLAEWGIKKYTLDEDRVDIKLKHIWIETKQKNECVYEMLSQAIFTAHKIKGNKEMPLYFGCFNATKGAIIENYQVQDVFLHSDINWTQTPSKIDKKTIDRIKFLLKEVQEYDLEELGKRLIEIEKTAFLHKKEINKNNFVIVYNEWVEAIGKNLVDKSFNPDCYLADLMSDAEGSIADKLQAVLGKDFNDFVYKIKRKIEKTNETWYQDIEIKDQKSYLNFWSKYQRPPKEEYQDYILNRRDLLQPANVREVKGEFFTPKIWCDKSKEYIAKAFGADWQDEYYIWDCCTGTGNLTQGLVNQDRVFMSTLNEEDIKIMQELNTMPDSVKFQYDFLNDEWKPKFEGGKIPDSLWKIIKETPEKLIIYINPPYLEVSSHKAVKETGKAKTGSTTTDLKIKMLEKGFGKESNELFLQFYYRLYTEIKGVKICSFSKLKNCNAPNFENFRTKFKATFCGGFVCKADTFDNVKGKFPISFQIWDCEKPKDFEQKLCFDILNNEGEFAGIKEVCVHKKGNLINDWFLSNNKSQEEVLCYIAKQGSDFQQQGVVSLYENKCEHANKLTQSNIRDGLVYTAVRLCIPATWLNDRDQFTKPNFAGVNLDKPVMPMMQKQGILYEFENDLEFIDNCIVFSLFEKNYTNWILFPNSWIGINGIERDMTIYNLLLKGKTFSQEAQNVIDLAKEIYKLYYTEFENYHASWNEVYRALKDSKNVKFVDMWEDFKKFKKLLAAEVAEGVYKYGFLKN